MKAQLTQEAKNAIIEALNQVEYEDGDYFDDAIGKCKEVVQSFQVSDGWIPVSERFPKESELVMVYGSKSQSSFGIQFATFHDWLNRNAFYDDEGFELIVTHWQPLPNPPNKRSE